MSDDTGQEATPPPSSACRPGHLNGQFERAERNVIVGWAVDEANPDLPVELEVLINGESAGFLLARLFRRDLLEAGIGDGCHSFVLYVPQGLSPNHTIRVRRRTDGAELPGSPRALPCEQILPETSRQTITRAVDAVIATGSLAELDALIRCLVGRAALLLQERETPLPAACAAMVARWTGAPAFVIEPDPRPRALFVDERVPDPNRDAGSNAVISHMRSLIRLGFRVDFAAEALLAEDDAMSRTLQAMGITCWNAPWIASVEEVLRHLGGELDVVYLHRFGLMQRYAALVRSWCPAARLIYSLADLHYLRLLRRMAVEAGRAMDEPKGEAPHPGSDLPEEVVGLRTAELLMALAADAVITHSSFERALLQRDVPEAEVHLVPWEVPARRTTVAFTERRGVAFIGSYGHPPNLDAAYFLLESVMPIVWAGDPTLTCLLVGSELPASLRAAAQSKPEGLVLVLGQVASLRQIWDQVRLSVAPLRYGAGIKGKVLDSLAAGIPCVITPIAAEGLDLPHGLCELVGDSATSLAANILRMHNDGPANAAIANSGLAWVRENLSAACIDRALAASVQSSAKPG